MARAGAQVRVAVLTRGDGGIAPDAGAISPEQRRAESVAACEALGTEPPVFCGLTSAALKATPSVGSRALESALGDWQADYVLVPWPLERHETHRASLLAALTSRVAASEACWLGYGAWDAVPAWADVFEVDVTAARMAKTLAVRAHISQDRPRALAAAILSRDASHAAFSRLTGNEARRAVERFLDLTLLARRVTAAGDDGAGLRSVVASHCQNLAAQWVVQLWS